MKPPHLSTPVELRPLGGLAAELGLGSRAD